MKKYTYEEVYNATLKYFHNDDLATNVWISKYCQKILNEDKSVTYLELTPDDMHHRLAKEFYRAGLKYNNPLSENEIYNLFKDFKYIVPQGRPMAGIGTDDTVSISNCFVVGKPNQDSYGTIALIDQQIMQISKRGGGTGTDLSNFRPSGSKTHNAALTSSGPVEICANRFSNTIREVGQSGRRGALMLSMSINHPDAEEFMDSKMEEGKITGANISLKIYDDWLKEALNPNNQNGEKTRLWKKIIHNATAKAEPGILFWDTIIRESVADCYKDNGFETTSTNPCGELPLCPLDSCRLMLLNLFSYVENPFTSDAYFNFELFDDHSRKIMKLMDNMIDLEIEKIDKIITKIQNDPEDEETKKIELDLWKSIKAKCLQGRRSGIGITGEGDMLASLGFKYGEKDATKFAEQVQWHLSINSYIESCDLVQKDGRPSFECFDYQKEKNNPFLNRLIGEGKTPLENEFAIKWKNGRRNIALLTIAPAGSVSCLTQTTSGIEPLFMPKYKRKRKIDKTKGIKPDFIDSTGDWFEEYNIVHDKFTLWYSIYKGIDFSDALKELEEMSDETFDNIFKESPYFQSTANDCNWQEKVRMQGRIQKYVDHSISVTVNLPKGTKEELVKEIYETAWKEGCKGCTIYVDGSRDGVLTRESSKECNCHTLTHNAPKRPKTLPCEIFRFKNGGEKWIAAVGLYEGKPYEIFTGLADKLNLPDYVTKGEITKTYEIENVIGDDDAITSKKVSRYDIYYANKKNEKECIEGISKVFNPEFYNYSKFISGLLRHGMNPLYVISTIKSMNFGTDNINSWKNGIMRSMKPYTEDGETSEKCPSCGEKLYRESGCCICKKCGYSKCN